jgi:Fic family protein
MHLEYSRDLDIARRQRLAVAHIRAEMACEASLDELGEPDAVALTLYQPEALQWIHGELFTDLDEDDLRLEDGSLLAPGEWRQRQVRVGRHEAPLFKTIPAFLARWEEAYGGTRRGEIAIVAAAASHHRLAWVHPFADGNGRVARLHTHLVLRELGLTRNLWSPLRGFARTESRYKALLAAADEHRRGDLDGRGNLTESGLIDWINYCMDVFIDQANFMARQLDVSTMRERIGAALTFEQDVLRSGVRVEATTPLHYLFAAHPTLTRAEFKTLTGLGERVSTSLVSTLLQRGYLASDTPYGELRFAIPERALRFYFPALWPEAEQEQATLARP